MTILLIIAKVDIIMGTDQYSILLGAYQITVQFQFMRHSQQRVRNEPLWCEV